MNGRQAFPRTAPMQAFPQRNPSQAFPRPFKESRPRVRQYIPLVEMEFASETVRVAPDGVATPQGFYEPRLLDIGDIEREVPILPGLHTVAGSTLELSDIDNRFSKLKATDSFRNVPVRYKLGEPVYGLRSFVTLFQAKTGKWKFNQGRVTFRLHDASLDRFRVSVAQDLRTCNSAVFPDIPAETPPALVPVIYGLVFANTDAAAVGPGPIPCYRIDPNAGGKWRYVVAQHVCKSIGIVYVYGVLQGSGYTVTTAAYDGTTMTVIDFDADPADPERIGEMEVTVGAVQGITDDGTAGGAVIMDAVLQLEHLLVNYFAVDPSELDSETWTAAKAASLAAEREGAIVLVDRAQERKEVLARWLESFVGAFFATPTGEFALSLHGEFPDSDGLLSLTDQNEILADSFSIDPADQAASRIQYNHQFHFVREFFEFQPDAHDTAEETRLGEDLRENKNLWFVRAAGGFSNPAQPQEIAAAHQDLLREGVQVAEFDVPMRLLKRMDLKHHIAVTHFEGISEAGGYQNAVFQILSIAARLNPNSSHVRIKAWKPAAEVES